MLSSDMNLKIRLGTVRYDNKILISDGKFSLGKNEKVNLLEAPAMKSPPAAVTHKDLEQTSATHRDLEQKPNTTHKEEKIGFVLFLTGIFTKWYMFQ